MPSTRPSQRTQVVIAASAATLVIAGALWLQRRIRRRRRDQQTSELSMSKAAYLSRLCKHVLPSSIPACSVTLYVDSQIRVYKVAALEGVVELPRLLGAFWIFPCVGTIKVSGCDPELCASVKSMREYLDISAATATAPFPPGSSASLCCQTEQAFSGIIVEWREDASSWLDHISRDRTDEGYLRSYSGNRKSPVSGLGMGPEASEILYEDSSVRIWDQWIPAGGSEKGLPHMHHRDYWLVSLGFNGMRLDVPGSNVQTCKTYRYNFGFSTQKATAVSAGGLELAANQGDAPYRGVLIEPKEAASSYLAPLLFHSFGDGEPEWIVENACTGEPNEYINLEKDFRHVRMFNGRELDIDFSQHGLELSSMPTKVKDFYDEAEVRSVYFVEVEQLLRRVTSCSGAHIFDITRRTTGTTSPGKKVPVRSPAEFVHGDQTPESAPSRVRREAEHLLQKRRYCIVNVWRSISGSVEQKPMAFNLTSKQARNIGTLRPVKRTSRIEDRPSFIEMSVYSADDLWVTFPCMSFDEAVVFKTSDSADRLSAVAHTAFDDPCASPDAAPRQSMEIRAVCYWD